MSFRITGLSPDLFRPLFGLTDDALAARSAVRYVADARPGFPDRVTLRDAEVGQAVILVGHEHQSAATPYRSRHAIFVLEGAEETYDGVDEIPEVMAGRLMSLRAFDVGHMMVDADIAEGAEVAALIARLFADPRADYIHAHFARRGCYAARIDRA
jgi:Protein of unknown function (DUF1203)